jgi:hypothetical protein
VAASGVAALGFALFAPVRWLLVVPLAAGVPRRRLERAEAGAPDTGAGAQDGRGHRRSGAVKLDLGAYR